jgi:exoribonuclease R
MKELEYFERIASSPKPEVFKAVITRVLPIGLFVEVVDIQTRGIVRAGDPECGDYRFDAARGCLVTRNAPHRIIRASDILDVQPVGIERERGTVVFKIARKARKKFSPAGSG